MLKKKVKTIILENQNLFMIVRICKKKGKIMKEINMGHFGARIKFAFCKLNKPLFVKKKYLKI